MQVLEKILEEIDEETRLSLPERASGLIKAKEIIRSHMNVGKDTDVSTNNGWIPVGERLPEDDNYILLSFENFSLPLVGRYEENEKGGAFYVGDCNEEDTCVANDLFVNAWRRLPEPYNPEEPKQQKNTQQEMEDFWRDK